MKTSSFKDSTQNPSREEALPFDDCLRILVNTPPKPKKAQAETGEEKPTESEQEH